MKICVSGACGFIGGELIQRLESIGYDIVAIDDVLMYEKLYKKLGKEPFKEFYDWNFIFKNKDANFLKDVYFTYHLGANSSTRATWEELKTINSEFSTWFITENNVRGIPIIFASSGAIYGSIRTKASKVEPLTMYGYSKVKVEQFITYLPHKDVIALRYHNVYGATESHKGNMASIVSKWMDNYFIDGKLTNELFYGSDKIKRDFIHVDDINTINIMFLDFYNKYKQLPDTNILDVGSGVATSFESVAKHIVKHTKGSVQYIINPYNESNYQFYTKADIKGIKDTYLWLYDKPFEPLNISDGVSRVFNQKYNKWKIH
jgi:ADP-L-glycero-D-manno-heptose 6-epimerase